MRWAKIMAALLGVALAVAAWWIHAGSKDAAPHWLPGIAALASR